jgi:hypothetical protein
VHSVVLKGYLHQSLVGRYYDPSTDQFLSVDPDVAETGQPYAFTGDDPLNATDPLGLAAGHLSADAECKDLHKSNSKAHKFCVTARKKQIREGPIDKADQRLLKQARRYPIAMSIALGPFAYAAGASVAATVTVTGITRAALVTATALSVGVGSPLENATTDTPPVSATIVNLGIGNPSDAEFLQRYFDMLNHENTLEP